ncbi:threonine-phosphate decarboxylase CobD [Ruminiclostridium hungatei]|nr:threonine-phosphate decarboxylase CobD [Ruminiclostridium hungatei]
MMVRTVHGGDIYSKYDIGHNRRLIDFSANINPLGLPEGVKKAIFENIGQFSNYPDPVCRELAEKIALHENVPQDYIICGNGAADIIYRIAGALKPGNTLVTAPSFSEYEEAVRLEGGGIKYHYLSEARNFLVGRDILKALTPDIRLVFLCNPNNPTGKLTEKETVLELAGRCRDNNCTLVVDECFMDFLDDPHKYSVSDCLESFENVIVLKAFTKIYAMAGIRLGYALCSCKELLERLKISGQPWGVSAVAQICGVAALDEHAYISRTKKLVRRNREYLLQELDKLGYKVFDSAANYILFKTENRNLHKELLKYGILARSCNNYAGLDEKYIRVAVKLEQDNQYLIGCLQELEAARGK